MNFAELIQHAQTRILRDKSTPGLWAYDEIVSYFNEAQDQFARRTHCLVDETSSFTFLDTEADTATYTLDARVIYVYEIHRADGIELRRGSRGNMPRTTGSSKPRYFATDAAVRTLRLYPTPDAAYTLDLFVARKPLARLVNDTDEPEIDEDYHLTLCDWVAYRALRNNDVDGSNIVESDKFRLNWEMAVRAAKRDVMRYRASGTRLNNWTGK